MQSLTDEASSVASDNSSVPSLRDLSPATLKSIQTKGDIPTPRSNFSLCKFSSRKVFLYGGCDDKNDLNDAYILDLISMKWSAVDMSIKSPLVGHCSVCLYRSLNSSRPYIYIFGGWDGSGYSDKGVLINPKTLDVLVSNYNDPVIDWSSSSRGSHPHSANSDSPGLMRSASLLGQNNSTKKTTAYPPTPTSTLNSSRDKTFKTAQSMTVSNPAIGSRKVTWFASVRSDKGKSENNFKKIFAEKVPFSRRDHTLTVDSEAQRIFLYGGWNSFHWTFDESKFLEMWTLDSNWRWMKETLKGDIPQARRGHTSVCLEKQRSLIIYGGCSGYNAILDDCYEYDIQSSTFTKIEKHEDKFYPEGRAWHSASVIGPWIYYYGGLKPDFKASSEVLTFDIVKYEWHSLKYTTTESIPDTERFAHKTFNASNSILILGGSTYEQEQNEDLDYNSGADNLKEKKILLNDILLLETDEISTFDKNLLVLKEEEEKEKEEQIKLDLNKEQSQNLKPPPIPSEFKNPLRLVEDQSNFLHWNPHIFPNEANKLKIHHFKQKAEEEARKNSYNMYTEFEGLEDEEFVSPGSSKKNV